MSARMATDTAGVSVQRTGSLSLDKLVGCKGAFTCVQSR